MSHLRVRSLGLLSCGLFTAFLAVGRSAPAAVQELRTQKVGGVTYFHVRLERPKEMLADNGRPDLGWFAGPAPSLAPRLVAPGGELRLVCQRSERGRPAGPGVPVTPGLPGG